MKYKVTLRKEDGSESTEVVEAQTRFAVYSQVEKDGATVVSLEEKSLGFQFSSLKDISFGSGVKTQQKITFTKNLSAMLAAGLTLSRALSVIERQTENKNLKKVVTDLENSVKEGSAFHEGLAEHKNIFSRLFIAMTKAGEEGGTLAETLGIVGKQMEASHTLTKKIRGAMIYPSIILAAIVVIGILMLIYVVPTLSSTFASLGVELPISTRIIIGASDFAVNNVILVFLSLFLLIGGMVFFARSLTGHKLILMGALRLPVIGNLVQETYSARAARTLSSLLSSGVDMLAAISITADVVGKNKFGAVLEEAEERVKRGEALSAAFNDYPKLYPVFVAEMVSVGEETGKVSGMLSQVAEYYETDVEARTKDLSTIIEPVLMLLIGAFVGIFAVSMMSPIYSLTENI